MIVSHAPHHSTHTIINYSILWSPLCEEAFAMMNPQYTFWFPVGNHTQARIQGGGPHFLGGGNKGTKNHTHRKKEINIGQPRSKIQAKTYTKTH